MCHLTQSVFKYFCNLIFHSLLCKFIAVINTCRIHYLNFHPDNSIMKTPKHQLIQLAIAILIHVSDRSNLSVGTWVPGEKVVEMSVTKVNSCLEMHV